MLFSADFYPRSPCGERPPRKGFSCPPIEISIHALLAESDRTDHIKRNKKVKFLSTLSLRRATHSEAVPRRPHADISIHALLAESDAHRFDGREPSGISIHALLAESDESQDIQKETTLTFLSTHS